MTISSERSVGYERILSPITIGNLTLPNRVVLAPMGTEMGTEDGRSTPREAAYYGARARGGTALVMTGVNFLQSDLEPIAPGLARADTDEHTAGLKGIADAIHAEGGLAGLQLTPGLGRNNQYYDEMGMEPVSSSNNPYFFDPERLCRPLETDEIHLIVQRTGEAALRAYEAGFDVIDLHGHTGYLIDQFMSKVWNRRTDEYGGSPENRARFAVECLQAIRENAPGVTTSFRISVDHKFAGGRTWEETKDLIRALEEGGLDMILCDDGSYEAMDYVFPPYYLGDDCMVSAAARVKTIASIPVGACGNITPESGEKILERGEADLIVIGRGLIADPDIVNKLKEGRAQDIRPCIRCNQLCTGNAFFGKAIGCAVNPEVGYERERVITPTDTPKNIVVVGAGPAGIEFARVAGLRGHTVNVYDRADRIGGVLLPAATPEFKRELFRMIEWWERQLATIENVTINLNHEVQPGGDELVGADVIVVATGSHPFVPSTIEGAENAVDVLAFHEGAEIGKRVIVCGGGLSGADAALELAIDGHEVIVVEREEEIARDMLMLNRTSLLRELDKHNVQILIGTTVTSILPGGIKAENAYGPVDLEADTIITAFGLRPATELGEALGTEVITVGDCVAPRKVGDAVNDAYAIAFDI
ncbi:oxidoreductase [Flaviflexus massiliensis]|uniref:oxidoreductase n=1 Tax=Flaviflexus massiliensis TaxID=1522309 RepID=UPI0006D5AB7D|nr:FAD-dependent oxidoreductase [Flaviflexus massiliensis]